MADGPLVNGVVDVLAEEADGTALVVDYKSDRVGDADLEALVEASYGVQRRIYGLACLRAGAPAVEVVHHLPRARGRAGRPPLRGRPTRPTSSASCASGRPGCSRASSRSRPSRTAALCATCPGRAGLCSYPPALTDRTVEDAVGMQ